jgi:coproporphyrinogen III oxidase-like Fe-S oxidoreductase
MVIKMLVINQNKYKQGETELNQSKIFKMNTNKKDFFINSFLNDSHNKNVLYVHTPFCLQKCSYCTCGSKATFSQEEFNEFYERLIPKHIFEYKKIFDSIIFDQVYFGGGTPTIANAKVLHKVFELIPNFKDIPNKCIEASPHTLTMEHLFLFKKYNFNFLSIGIQSLDKSICKKHNRPYITRQELETLSLILNEMGFYYNYDLIAFLDKGDVRDLKAFETELDFILKTNPSCVTIHQYYQSFFTEEKTKALILLLKNSLSKNKNFLCSNSMLDIDDAYNDVLYQAEYRLVSNNKNYSHYMWNKYASIPVQGYNILSIGYWHIWEYFLLFLFFIYYYMS